MHSRRRGFQSFAITTFEQAASLTVDPPTLAKASKTTLAPPHLAAAHSHTGAGGVRTHDSSSSLIPSSNLSNRAYLCTQYLSILAFPPASWRRWLLVWESYFFRAKGLGERWIEATLISICLSLIPTEMSSFSLRLQTGKSLLMFPALRR